VRRVGKYRPGKGRKGETVMVAAGNSKLQVMQRKLALLVQQHERLEDRMARATRAWDRSRSQLKRYEARVEKLLLTPEPPPDPGFGD
jgi:hypothetical protein